MDSNPIYCLILACGNPLRSDDGVGPWLAAWAEDRFHEQRGLLITCRQQWTPDLAKDVAAAEAVLFMDCSVESAAGVVALTNVHPSAASQGLQTHHLGSAELLRLALDLYGSAPPHAWVLTIGAASTALGEELSAEVLAALPQACALIEETVLISSKSRDK